MVIGVCDVSQCVYGITSVCQLGVVVVRVWALSGRVNGVDVCVCMRA